MAFIGACSVPKEDEFLAAFGVEPCDSRPADGYWAYEFADGAGNRAIVSFNAHERSLQTVSFVAGISMATISSEGLGRLWLDESEGLIRAEFDSEEDLASFSMRPYPSLEVRWWRIRRGGS